MRGCNSPSALIHMGKRFQHECTAKTEDGKKCMNAEVSGGFCAFHHPSLVIERAAAKKDNKQFVVVVPKNKVNASAVSTHVPNSPILKEFPTPLKRNKLKSTMFVPPTSQRGTMNSALSGMNELERQHGFTDFRHGFNAPEFEGHFDELPSTDSEWEQYVSSHTINLREDHEDAPYQGEYPPVKKGYKYRGFYTTPTSAPVVVKRDPVELEIGKYRLIGSVDPTYDAKTATKFHIPQMQYFILRTSKGYRAVWMSHCGVGVKGKPATEPLFNWHWSNPYKTFEKAEDQFYRGGESFFRIRERIANAKDPKWLPPNARKLANRKAWETLKLTGASDALIERLKAWEAAGSPGWRTWNGSTSTPRSDKEQETQIQKWMKKHGWKR